ncbi:MAG TPA: hypothetical protein VF712_14325 [Thermoleophilaceae bacterium]|jgi:uncharacterized membrane protein YczE
MSRWRATPRQLAVLLAGLCLFGAGEGLLVDSELGNSPWTVLSEGVTEQTGVDIGTTTVAISFLVLAMWIPLRERPGLGTILNAVVVGTALGVTVALVPDAGSLPLRGAEVAGGIAIVAIGSGFYLTTRLGAGPRDGLMLGLHRRTGLSVRLVRTTIESAAVIAGFVLGGTVGIGTLAFALGIGPAVQLALGRMTSTPAHEL